MENKLERTEKIKLLDINKLSKKYIADNTEEVRINNQRMLKTIAIIYLIVIIAYNVIVPIFFSDWGVNYVYQIALIVHVVILPIILLRYRSKDRSLKEVQVVSGIFQLYIIDVRIKDILK